ncbi:MULTISPECIES: hypothetical protein [Bradyrhizobium]|uniref:hypothetical protein n=1 Tax=Bradyrhizobium TaxID=374 RepID=UPI000A07853B|nr:MULTISPECIES: hypothetical protein [Bradyrhizobium]QOG23427.1 hypothetical protein FOM02_45505 [Bradyrhizobium sp. SEMIA]UFW48551.1 hypothetical protein BaraCB756_40950 [Bradyrhizobium arachidis]
MIDPLLARAQLAIEESKALQKEKLALQAEQLHSRGALRLTVMESAMYRTESKAHRDNRE